MGANIYSYEVFKSKSFSGEVEGNLDRLDMRTLTWVPGKLTAALEKIAVTGPA